MSYTKFAQLRERANVSLARLQRISLDQLDVLISRLLEIPSGGRFPVLFVIATFTAIKTSFTLDWVISWQGINAPDIQSGAGGDITISSGDTIFLAAEITERSVDRNRVVATFNTKIAPNAIQDYLFFVKSSAATLDAAQQAHQYFAQGHEVNFLEIKSWILMMLATLGASGRAIFNEALLELLDSGDVPQALKVSWNEQIETIAAG